MEQDLPFVILGAPTSGAPGERVLIRAQHVVVFGVENGFDFTPNKWEGFVADLLQYAVDSSNMFTAYEVGPSSDLTGYFVAARCYESRADASKLYSWLREKLPAYRKYRSGVWYVGTPADSPGPVRLEMNSWRDFAGSCGNYLSVRNFELHGNRGIRWEILPSVPFGHIFVRPFGPVVKSPAVETGLRPDLSVL